MKIKHFTTNTGPDKIHGLEAMVEFLFLHLDQYGDSKSDIHKCLEYAFNPAKGGDVFLCVESDRIIGTLVINHTGMQGYIPENILVYIAVHKDSRGQGIGKILMQEALNKVNGSIALHVEPDNPALHLYKKLGFVSKYVEMRLTR